jgi:hypothetical protein
MKLVDTISERLAQLPKGPVTILVFLPALVWFSITTLRDEVWGGKNAKWYNYILSEPIIFGIAWLATSMLTGAGPLQHSASPLWHGIAIWILFEAWLAPLLYLGPIKRLGRFTFDTAWPKIEKVTEKYIGPFLTGVVNTASALAPGSGWVWKHVEETSWAIRGLQVLGGFAAGAYTLYCGWLLKGILIDVAVAHHLLAAAPATILGTVLTICTYFIAFAAVFLVGGFVIASFEYAKKQGVGLAVGLGAAFAAHGLIGHLAAAYGYAAWVGYAATALSAFLLTVYAFPAIVAALSTGFIVKVWREDIRPLQREFFSGKETSFRNIVGQLANLVAAGFVIYYVLLEGSLIGLSLYATVPIAALLAFLSLSWVGEWLDGSENNSGIALVSAGLASAYTYKFGMAHDFVLGHFGCYVAAVIAGVLVGRFLVPLVFVGLERGSTAGPLRKRATDYVGGKLKGAHTRLMDKAYKPLVKLCEGVYEDGYTKPKADAKLKTFRLVVLHLTNIALAIGLGGATCWGTSSLLAAYPDLALFGLSLHWPIAVIGYGLAALVAFLSYSLIGHAILEAGFEIAGFLLGMVTGVWTSVHLHSVQPQGWLFAVPVGMFVMAVTFGFVAPLLIQVAQYVGVYTPNWILTPLAGLNDAAFKKTVKLWNRFVVVRKWLDETFAPIMKTLREIMDGLRGNKKKQ